MDAFDAIEAELKRLSKDVEAAGAAAVEDVAKAVVVEAKRLAPVDSGATREAIDYEMGEDKQTATVGIRDDVERQAANGERRDPEDYAEKLEYGEPGRAAVPFMRPALGIVEQQAPALVTRRLNEAIGRASK